MASNSSKLLTIGLVLTVCTIGAGVFGAIQAGKLAYQWLDLQGEIQVMSIFNLLSNAFDEANDISSSTKLQVVLALAVGVVITLTPFLLALLWFKFINPRLNPKEEIFGSARFAKAQEIKRAGLLPSAQELSQNKYPSVLIGKFKNKFMHFTGQQFVYLAAPTRSGKGVGIVIPNLLNYSDSVVVVDIKFENFINTAGFRQQQGQEIYLFAPDGFAENEEIRQQGLIKSHRYNPLYYVRRDLKYRDSDIQKIFTCIFPAKKDDMWNDLASNFARGMTAYLMDLEANGLLDPAEVTLPKLVELGGESDGYVGVINRAIQCHEEGEFTLSPTCLAEFNKFLALHEQGQQSVLMTFSAEMGIYSTPTCKEAMSGNDFDFNDLRKKPMSLYVGLTPNSLASYAKIINLFFSQLIMTNTQVMPEQDANLKYQVLLVLDEFPALGAVNILADAIGYTAGYNLRYLIIVQDHSQTEAIYGKEKALNIRKNCAVQLIYPPKTVDEYTKQISETLGYKTVKKKEYGSSSSRGRRTRNTNDREQQRALMLPQEIVELGNKVHKSGVSLKEIVIMERLKPFIADKIIYFDETAFVSRQQLAKANIPHIPLLFKSFEVNYEN